MDNALDLQSGRLGSSPTCSTHVSCFHNVKLLLGHSFGQLEDKETVPIAPQFSGSEQFPYKEKVISSILIGATK